MWWSLKKEKDEQTENEKQKEIPEADCVSVFDSSPEAEAEELVPDFDSSSDSFPSLLALALALSILFSFSLLGWKMKMKSFWKWSNFFGVVSFISIVGLSSAVSIFVATSEKPEGVDFIFPNDEDRRRTKKITMRTAATTNITIGMTIAATIPELFDLLLDLSE